MVCAHGNFHGINKLTGVALHGTHGKRFALNLQFYSYFGVAIQLQKEEKTQFEELTWVIPSLELYTILTIGISIPNLELNPFQAIKRIKFKITDPFSDRKMNLNPNLELNPFRIAPRIND